MKIVSIAGLIALGVVLCGCATPSLETPSIASLDVAREAALQRKFVIEKRRDQQILLSRVMYKLSTGAADFCGEKVTGAIGTVTMTAKAFPGEYEAVARSEYGLDDGLTVVAVMPDSPAFSAGLQPDDHIVSVDGVATDNGVDGAKALKSRLKQSADAHGPVRVSIRRKGVAQTLSVTPVRACDYPASIKQDNDINAYADGEQIIVNTGLLNFVRSDQELAVPLSHEMSHNILGHLDKRRQNTILAGAAGLAVDIIVAATTGVNPGLTSTAANLGAAAYSVQFEQEADYEGLYIMSHAGSLMLIFGPMP